VKPLRGWEGTAVATARRIMMTLQLLQFLHLLVAVAHSSPSVDLLKKGSSGLRKVRVVDVDAVAVAVAVVVVVDDVDAVVDVGRKMGRVIRRHPHHQRHQ
jgi:hypothetical protein